MDEVTGTTAEHRHSSGSLSTDYKEKKNSSRSITWMSDLLPF